MSNERICCSLTYYNQYQGVPLPVWISSQHHGSNKAEQNFLKIGCTTYILMFAYACIIHANQLIYASYTSVNYPTDILSEPNFIWAKLGTCTIVLMKLWLEIQGMWHWRRYLQEKILISLFSPKNNHKKYYKWWKLITVNEKFKN